MNQKMRGFWNEAAANPGKKVDIGRLVVCDWCEADYTDRPESGGVLFGSKAACPGCVADGFEERAKSFGEARFIRERCPDGVSFADWIRGMRERDGSNFIRIIAPPPASAQP